MFRIHFQIFDCNLLYINSTTLPWRAKAPLSSGCVHKETGEKLFPNGSFLFCFSSQKNKRGNRLKINTVSTLGQQVTLVRETERDYGHGLINSKIFYFAT